MAVKSYQAQGEGEISLSKGEKIKGDRVGLGGGRVRGSSKTACALCTLGTLKSPERPLLAWRRERHYMGQCEEERR
jgi:hypothetical protein